MAVGTRSSKLVVSTWALPGCPPEQKLNATGDCALLHASAPVMQCILKLPQRHEIRVTIRSSIYGEAGDSAHEHEKAGLPVACLHARPAVGFGYLCKVGKPGVPAVNTMVMATWKAVLLIGTVLKRAVSHLTGSKCFGCTLFT